MEKKHPNDVSNFQAKLFFLTNADMCLFVEAIGCKPFPPWNINFQNIKLFPTNLIVGPIFTVDQVQFLSSNVSSSPGQLKSHGGAGAG